MGCAYYFYYCFFKISVRIYVDAQTDVFSHLLLYLNSASFFIYIYITKEEEEEEIQKILRCVCVCVFACLFLPQPPFSPFLMVFPVD